MRIKNLTFYTHQKAIIAYLFVQSLVPSLVFAVGMAYHSLVLVHCKRIIITKQAPKAIKHDFTKRFPPAMAGTS